MFVRPGSRKEYKKELGKRHKGWNSKLEKKPTKGLQRSDDGTQKTRSFPERRRDLPFPQLPLLRKGEAGREMAAVPAIQTCFLRFFLRRSSSLLPRYFLLFASVSLSPRLFLSILVTLRLAHLYSTPLSSRTTCCDFFLSSIDSLETILRKHLILREKKEVVEINGRTYRV
jgi:hypothetical protein